MEIRIATEKDIDNIIDLAYEIWPATYYDIVGKAQVDYMLSVLYAKSYILNQWQNPGHTFFILKQNNEEIGYAHTLIDEANNATAKLSKLYVKPSTQGQGFGEKLLTHAIAYNKNLGVGTMCLNVNRYNKALGFYQKMGFEIIKEVDIPFGEFWLNDYEMKKNIL